MGDTVDLDARFPHRQAPAQCLSCGYEWYAVAPTGVAVLECPKCSKFTGVFAPHHEPED